MRLVFRGLKPGILAGLVLALGALGCGGRSVAGGGDGGGVDARAGDAGDVDGSLGDAGAGPCATLSLAQCRLRADCAPDICWLCTCQPEFEGCRVASDPPFQCPELGCMQPPCCKAQSECDAMGGTCAPPGTPSGCGMCDPDPGDCAADGDCNAGSVCEPVHCSCDGASRCVPGCAQPTDCAAGTRCAGGDHPRCEPSACDAASPCPADFDCDEGACARRLCTSDLECDHYCVLGLCYDAYGECAMPMP